MSENLNTKSPLYLTVAEAVDQTNLTESLIQILVNSGVVESMYRNKHENGRTVPELLILESSLRSYLRKRTELAQSELKAQKERELNADKIEEPVRERPSNPVADIQGPNRLREAWYKFASDHVCDNFTAGYLAGVQDRMEPHFADDSKWKDLKQREPDVGFNWVRYNQNDNDPSVVDVQPNGDVMAIGFEEPVNKQARESGWQFRALPQPKV